MMATAQAKKLEDPFRDESMKVPLCGEPGYQDPDAGDDFYDPRFAGLDTRGSGVDSKGLKEFLSNPDRESVLDTRDPELVAEYNRQHAVSVVQCNGVPFQVYQREGKWRAKGVTPDGTLHRFTGDTRDEVLDKLAKLSQQVQRENVRDLNETELTQVARLAQRDRVAAINLYLSLAVPESYTGKDANELLNDPSLRGFLERATEFVWLNSRLDATDSPQWQEFKNQFIAGRPVSCALLDSAYSQFCEQRNRRLLPSTFEHATKEEESTPAEVQAGIEDLTDSEVQKLYWSTARHIARAAA